MCTDSGLGRLGQSAFTGKSATVNRLCSVGFSKQVERSWSVQRLCKYFQLLTGKYSKRRVITKKKKKKSILVFILSRVHFQSSSKATNPRSKDSYSCTSSTLTTWTWPQQRPHLKWGAPLHRKAEKKLPWMQKKRCKLKSPLIAFRFPLSSDQRITDFLKWLPEGTDLL